MGLISELRRRNVLRMAVLYGIAAWLIMQVAEVVMDLAKLPDWIGPITLGVLAVGFPIALLFSWFYELTPEGISLEKDVDRADSMTHVTGRRLDFIVISLLCAAVILFAYDKWWMGGPPEQSIAVLPFVNMSDDPGNEYFSDGMSEEILNLLARIPDLKVIGRTSSFKFKGMNEDLRVIGQTLGVTMVLEGSVRKSGERVRITVQLIDVSDGSHIWSETYDRTMTDIFAVQDDVAAAIIDALQIHVGTNPTRGRPTESPVAYTLFLKARASFSASEWLDAKELLLKAIERDPNFAEAYELLAFTEFYLGGDVEAQRLVAEAAAKAISLDPDLVLAQTLYQMTIFGPYLHWRAIEAFDRAAREQPDNPWILDGLIFLLTEYGYLEEALRLSERYIELDPLSLVANSHWLSTLYAAGRTSEVAVALEVANQLGSTSANWFIGAVNLMDNRDETAIAHFESYLQQHDDTDSTWVRGLVTGARDSTSGQAYLDRRIPEIVAGMPEAEAVIEYKGLSSFYLYFGFLDRHFELILATKPSDSTWNDAGSQMWHGHVFRRLGFTEHPKYLEVAELMGIINVWEQRGPPDFCEKVGGEWVCN